MREVVGVEFREVEGLEGRGDAIVDIVGSCLAGGTL